MGSKLELYSGPSRIAVHLRRGTFELFDHGPGEAIRGLHGI